MVATLTPTKPRTTKTHRRHSTCCSPIDLDLVSMRLLRTPKSSPTLGAKDAKSLARTSMIARRRSSLSASPIRKSCKPLRSSGTSHSSKHNSDTEDCSNVTMATDKLNECEEVDHSTYFGVFKPRYNFKTSKNNLLDDIDLTEMMTDIESDSKYKAFSGSFSNLNSYLSMIPPSLDQPSGNLTPTLKYHPDKITHRNNMIMLHSLHLLCTALCEKRNQFKVDVFDGMKKYIEEKQITEQIINYHSILLPLVNVIKDRDLNHEELDVVSEIQSNIQTIISATESH